MIKDIMVCVNNSRGRDNLIRAAANFALANNARLTGLYIMSENLGYLTASGMVSVELIQQILDDQKKWQSEAKAVFNKITAAVGCDAIWHAIEESDNPERAMFYTDLIFMSQPEKQSDLRYGNTGFVNHILLKTGRPVILIPDDWSEKAMGKHILLGWLETREAVRAMHDAVPLMQQADKVDVVTVIKGENNDTELVKGIEISAYLARKELDCRFHAESVRDLYVNEGEILLSHAQSQGIDLIITGGYGHSRLREIVLGGVTQYLMLNSRVPLFLSH